MSSSESHPLGTACPAFGRSSAAPGKPNQQKLYTTGLGEKIASNINAAQARKLEAEKKESTRILKEIRRIATSTELEKQLLALADAWPLTYEQIKNFPTFRIAVKDEYKGIISCLVYHITRYLSGNRDQFICADEEKREVVVTFPPYEWF